MTDLEINIAIAEACPFRLEPTQAAGGWQLVCGTVAISFWWTHDKKPTLSDVAHLLPNYCHDLNAMHDAEKALTLAQCVVYAERLCWFKCMDVDRPIEGPQSFIWGATARQRAEAFLRTIGKWKA